MRISNKSYSQNFIIDSKVIWHKLFYDTSVNFLCTYPFLYIVGMCDVTYIGIYNIYLHGKCFLSAVQRYNLPRATTVNVILSVYWLKFTRVCHSSKQFTTHRPTSHFLRKYKALLVCFCSEHTRHRRCFPLEGSAENASLPVE